MSEDKNDNKTKALDLESLEDPVTRKTSAVPIRKETVRVTLKSTPAGAKKSAPPRPKAPSPTAMTQFTEPQTVSAPKVSKPDIPEVTSEVSLKKETMRVTLKSDRVKEKITAPVATKAANGAPVVAPPAPMVAPPSVVKAPGAPKPAAAPPQPANDALKMPAPAPTVALNLAAPVTSKPQFSTEELPKATVQLQQTQKLEKPSPVTPTALGTESSPLVQTVINESSDEESGSKLLNILAVAAFVMALFLLFTQFQRAGIWVNAHEGGSYGSIFSGS